MTLSDRPLSFGVVAEDYHRWRPSYPPAAVDWLAPAAPARSPTSAPEVGSSPS